MYDYKSEYRKKIAEILTELLENEKIDGVINEEGVTAEKPPSPEMGDLGFPMFAFAKLFRLGPPKIASMVAEKLPGASALGPYVNVNLNRAEALKNILSRTYSRPETLKGSRVMVEFSSPNTNKPLHLGHLRNDALGESISRILSACGAEVFKVCIINDRGIHICKSMLAYKEHGEGKTPESESIKSDHFVGDWYVRFSKDLKEEIEVLQREQGLNPKAAEAEAPLQKKAHDLLRLWEAGDDETVNLWKKMNAWAFDGWQETYKRTDVSFNKYYYESQTYLLGKNEILKGLEDGIFYREEDGSVQVDLSAEKLDKKVLLRKDGTSLYITQDLGTAIYRHRDWPFDKLVYVVGSEQVYHFKVLFTLLKKLKFDWAENLHHLSYGMVNLPDGKMKSREGTVVDADDLIDSLKEMALQEMQSKDREEAVGDLDETAEKIAVGALHYYLLQVTPTKDMLFNPAESLSFNGNTGPYLQYMGARISSLLRKAGERTQGTNGKADGCAPRFELLETDAEWELVKTLMSYNDALILSAQEMDPSVLTSYLYELAKGFSRFYHDCPILSADNPELITARLALCRSVLEVLKDALHLACIPFLEVM